MGKAMDAQGRFVGRGIQEKETESQDMSDGLQVTVGGNQGYRRWVAGYKRLCCVHGKTLNSFKVPLQK